MRRNRGIAPGLDSGPWSRVQNGRHCTGVGIMHIGQLARLADVPIDTVRYYERHGILPAPAREGSGYRRYESHDVRRLHFVRRAKALGFTIGEIRELLAPSPPRHGDIAPLHAAACDQLPALARRLPDLPPLRSA